MASIYKTNSTAATYLACVIRRWHTGAPLSAREQALIEETAFRVHQRVLMDSLIASSSTAD